MLGRTAAAVVASFALGACGGSGAPGPTATPPTTAASTTITTFGGVPGAAEALACAEDARTLQGAADAYATTHGAPAPSIDALVADGQISGAPTTSHGYVIGYDPNTGKVTAAGACTYP